MAVQRIVGGIVSGSVQVSWSVVLRRTADGLEYTGRNASTLRLSYWREGFEPVTVPAVDLPTVTSPWQAGGVREISATSMPGTYRVDWPDAAFAHGADWVELTVASDGGFSFNERVPLTNFVALSTGPAGTTAHASGACVQASSCW